MITFSGIVSAQKQFVTFTDITKKAGITFKLNFGDNSYRILSKAAARGLPYLIIITMA